MKTKFLTLFALVLCMGAFFLPISAYAMNDTIPPNVTAKITGNALSIEAKDADSGVEAVFIDDKRFNYRVDGALEVDARDYVGDGKTIAIYAVNFAGNKSDIVTLENPYYAEPAETPTESAVPTQSNPFTPKGQASVVDQATESDGKDFYSFTTPEGNIFYLIIDHQRNADNVYFLNAITEDDLAAIAEKSDKKGNSAIPTVEPKPIEKPTETEKPAEPETSTKENGNNGMMIFVVIGILAVGGAGYYFKILRPKQQAANTADDEPEENDGYDEEYETEEDEDETESEEENDGEDEPEDEK